MNLTNATEYRHQKVLALIVCGATACLVVCSIMMPLSLWAQENDGQTTPAQAPTARDELALQQSQIADKFSRLEKLILRMAEYDTGQNPRRAALLQKAIALTKEKHIRIQMETLVTLLNKDQLNRATDNQKGIQKDLEELLKLLMSEDRAQNLKGQRQRYLSYIKEIERILRQQRDVQGRTEGGVEEQPLAEAQQRVADRTAQLDSKIAENEGQGDESEDSADSDSDDSDSDDNDSDDNDSDDNDSDDNDSESEDGPSSDGGDGQSGDKKASEEEDQQDTDSDKESDKDKEPGDQDSDKADDRPGEKGDPKNGEAQDDSDDKDSESADKKDPSDTQAGGKDSPSEQDSKPSESGDGSKSQDGKPQESGDPQQSDSQGQQGESSDGEPSSSDPQQSDQEEMPARKRLQEAERRMREAQQRLEEARRDEAAEAQEKARQELEAAKAELEEILRQMREEEIERTLALLESRFRRMLEMQLQVYENTVRLDKIPLDRRDRLVDLEATKLSFQERRIVIEADKCLTLLQEEGSSVAFPESVGQMRDDMEQVVERLGQAKIGRITQGIEEDIIEALDEMVEALQQAQMDQEERRQQPPGQPPPGMSDEDQPLVDQIAELKMLKALQIRINKRTTRYSRLLDAIDDPAGQATDEELIIALQRLAEREARLHEITRDIVVGRNQ